MPLLLSIGSVLLILACSLLPAAGQIADAAGDSTLGNLTTSSSQQFRVYGDDRSARGTFASFAERQKTAFLRLLGEKDTWHHAIVIRLSGEITDPPVPRPIWWRINQIKELITLEIHVTLCSAFNRDEMTDVLLHVLALEMALRDIEVPVTAELIPRWLSIGLPRALELRRRGRQSSFFKTLFKLNLITSAEDILNAEREHTDSVARTVYEASAAGFVLMLLDQKDGASALGKLIHSFGGAHGKSGHSLLARFYPALIGTSERLEQTWILYCAKLNEPQATEFLSPEETEAHLIDALSVSFLEFSEIDENTEDSSARTTPRLFERIFQARKNLSEQQEDEPSTPSEDRPTRMFEGSLKDFERFIAREDRADILAPVRLRLRQLDIRSFPLHRPLIVDYHEIVTDLLAGKPSGIQKRLEDLETKREQLATLMKNVAAHLNDYEASQPAARSGVFDNYLKQIKVIENNASTDPDPISQYLMEAEEVLK